MLQKRIQLVETRVTGCEKLQDSLTTMQEDLSSVQDVQRQLLATVTDMGESLDTLVHRDQLASSSAAEDRVADSVSSRAGARELSPLLEKDEEDEDWVSKGLPNLGQEKTTIKAFPSGAVGGSLFSKGHHTISPPKVQIFRGPNTSGDASTLKQAGKVPLGNRADSPELGISVGAAPAGLYVGQLKMDMPPVFTASRQQNVRGWLTKMERYFRLMRYPTNTWIEVVATRLMEVAKAWFNGESQCIEIGARCA